MEVCRDQAGKAVSLTIIMCAYNEIGRIQSALDEVLVSLDGCSEMVEIVFVDNCSTDGTREWLGALHHPGMTVVLNERNLGKGGSIKRGIALSRGDYVVIHDPDLEYRADDIWGLMGVMRRTQASLVLGSRVLGGHVRYKYLHNYLGVRFLTWLINCLYGCRITDAATAMKLMNGDLARRLNLECDGFDLDFELVTRIARLGGKVEEVRIDYHPRSKDEGKKVRAWRDGLLALKAIVRDRCLPRSRFVRQLDEDEDTAKRRASAVDG